MALYGTFAIVAPSNFAEVHNDHLQILAEAGLPAYVLFLAALIAVAASYRQRSESNAAAEFSRVASLPLVLSFAILALGQFPLELAASTSATI